MCVYYLCTSSKAHGGKWENTFNCAIGIVNTSTCDIIHLKQKINKLRKTL
jgi:Zn-finger protein